MRCLYVCLSMCMNMDTIKVVGEKVREKSPFSVSRFAAVHVQDSYVRA